MSTNTSPGGDDFEQLFDASNAPTEFSTNFRGYDKDEVDAAFADLTAKLQQATNQLIAFDSRQRDEQQRRLADDEKRQSEARAEAERLKGELAEAQAKAAEAEQQLQALTSQLSEEGASSDAPQNKQQFEAVLRVAEEQANALIQNTATQAERLLESASEEVAAQRAELDADVARITAQAQRDADQVRLKMETEYTAHEARLERESTHAAEKISQAEQEAATIRTEAEKGAAALRSLVTRETAQMRADAEQAVREMNARVVEFEESLTRRQDDAQQEFLVLHNQAVAHAERITSDANEQVAASLDHAQRISAKADDYEKLMRAQAAQIEADAQARARENLERSQIKAQKIIDTVTSHTNDVVRDAEDRTRQLRWQQQQLTSFMAEVRELIRPDGVLASGRGIAVPDEITRDETDAGDESTEQTAADAEIPPVEPAGDAKSE